MTTTDVSQDRAVPPPLCDQAEWDELMAEMVADEAPRLFAVAHEVGERVDGWVAAWGLAFDDHVEVISDRGWMRLSSPDRALWLLGRRPNITAHIVWVDQPENDAPAPREAAS
jgi:hypothetical protein